MKPNDQTFEIAADFLDNEMENSTLGTLNDVLRIEKIIKVRNRFFKNQTVFKPFINDALRFRLYNIN